MLASWSGLYFLVFCSIMLKRIFKSYFDKEILAQPILTFHSNVNTKTIFVKTEDFLCFVEKIGFHAHIVEL